MQILFFSFVFSFQKYRLYFTKQRNYKTFRRKMQWKIKNFLLKLFIFLQTKEAVKTQA